MLALRELGKTHVYLDAFIFIRVVHDILKVGLNIAALEHLT